jgi:hypothetical protein
MLKGEIESRIQCQYIDIPFVYHYSDDNFHKFYSSLANTSNFEFLKLAPIQRMIEFNFDIVKTYSLRRLMLPYVLFVISYFFYFDILAYALIRNEDLKLIDSEDYNPDLHKYLYPFQFGLAGVVAAFATYFFMNEFRQLW